MKLFVGLGNPGKKYEKTRHNAGWMVVDALSEKLKEKELELNFKFENKFNADVLKTKDVILAKPQTFMNDSGDAVSAIANFYKIAPEDIYIIHDDLDINLGEYKIQKGKGPKGHNGILSVEEKLGTNDFWRVRVGIENRDSENRIHGEVYTLLEFEKKETEQLRETVNEIVIKLLDFL